MRCRNGLKMYILATDCSCFKSCRFITETMCASTVSERTSFKKEQTIANMYIIKPITNLIFVMFENYLANINLNMIRNLFPIHITSRL